MAAEFSVTPLRPRNVLRPGRTILDCSGPIHGEWISRALRESHAKVLLYRSDFRSEEIDLFPKHESFRMVSGNLTTVLTKMKEGISLIIDDLGSLHFHEQPLELLSQYYDALALDGEAWIRFPDSFWVFLENQHRVSLQEYLSLKFPQLVKKLLPSELDPLLKATASSPDGWVLLRKDRRYPKLFFHLESGTVGATSHRNGSPHAPFREFTELKTRDGFRNDGKSASPLRRRVAHQR